VEAAVDSQRAKENRGTLKKVLSKGLPMLEQFFKQKRIPRTRRDGNDRES
jgi:hypothetical protein